MTSFVWLLHWWRKHERVLHPVMSAKVESYSVSKLFGEGAQNFQWCLQTHGTHLLLSKNLLERYGGGTNRFLCPYTPWSLNERVGVRPQTQHHWSGQSYHEEMIQFSYWMNSSKHLYHHSILLVNIE